MEFDGVVGVSVGGNVGETAPAFAKDFRNAHARISTTHQM